MIPSRLPLHFVFEIEIRFIESVHPHVPILPAAGIANALRMHSNRVEWSEVPLNTPNLILKDLVVESRLEFPLSCRSGRDVHRRLPASQNHKVLLRCYRGGVERCVGDVGLEDQEIARRNNLEILGLLQQEINVCTQAYLGGLVLPCGNEVGPVWSHLEVVDLHVILVDLLIEIQFSRLQNGYQQNSPIYRRSLLTLASYWLTLPSS